MTTPGAPVGVGPVAPRRGEAGSVLVETIVSAVLLIAISFAVVNSLTTAARGTAENKGRSVAATLAEQDQERMRAMSALRLANYHPTPRAVTTPDGAAYTVTSRADWIRDSTGATQTCATANTEPDYLRISSTVTSRVVGTDIQPVVTRSVVSPPVGAFGPGQGTFAVSVIDSRGNPIPNFPVTATGPSSSPQTYSDITNDLGCVVFGYVPIGSFSGNVASSNYVDPDGNATDSATATVNEGKVSSVQLVYDKSGTINATLSAAAPAGGTALTVSNNNWTVNPVRRVTIPAGATTASFSGLFPYVSTKPYTVYAGSCDAENPNANSGTAPTAVVPPGGSTAVSLTLPLATVKVVKGATNINNANVKITASGCTEAPVLTTNSSGLTTVNLPYGNYSACADDNNGFLTKNRSRPLSNDDTNATLNIDLSSNTSPGKC
jgi:Tfp pilus assembly protein PilV